MFAAELLPKFGTNLVAALADLQQSKIVVCALRIRTVLELGDVD